MNQPPRNSNGQRRRPTDTSAQQHRRSTSNGTARRPSNTSTNGQKRSSISSKPAQKRPSNAAQMNRKTPSNISRDNKKPSSNDSRRSRPANRKNLYRKSRYFRQRQKQRLIIGGIGAFLLLLLLILLIRGCGKNDTTSTLSTNDVVSAEEISTEEGLTQSDEESVEETEPSVTPVPMDPVSLTVSVVGDCTLGTDEAFDWDTSLNAYYYSYGSEYFFQNVKSIFSADDLTIANFEGVLTELDTREDKWFAFKAEPEFASIVSAGDIEAVTLANNHSHDYGEQSFTDTKNALDAEGIVHFGYDETAVVDVKGVKVGLVGIYELNDHLGREEQLKANISKVKEEGAQLVIVIFHWGNEKETVPDSNQMTLGRMAIDEGADLVCGHHPHVLQGIEVYKGKNIVYSLGNFCFGGNSAPSDMDSMIFQQTFTIDEYGVQKDNITNVIPCSISSEYYYNNYQPTPSEGDEATRIANKIEERSSWIDTAEPQ